MRQPVVLASQCKEDQVLLFSILPQCPQQMPAESLPRSGRSHRKVTVNSLKDSLQSQHTWPKLTITLPLITTTIIYKKKKKKAKEKELENQENVRPHTQKIIALDSETKFLGSFSSILYLFLFLLLFLKLCQPELFSVFYFTDIFEWKFNSCKGGLILFPPKATVTFLLASQT